VRQRQHRETDKDLAHGELSGRSVANPSPGTEHSGTDSVKGRPLGGHSIIGMGTRTSIAITLGVGITLASIGVGGDAAAAAACRPGVRLDGDRALVDVVGTALVERGIAVGSGSGSGNGAEDAGADCAPLDVRLERRGDRISVFTPDGGGAAAMRRDVTDPRTATTIIESWVSVDVEAPLLTTRVVALAESSPARPPAPPAPAVATANTAPAPATTGRGVQLFAVAERARANDDTAWTGIELGACVALGPLCVGARARFAIARGPQLRAADLDRHGVELLLGVDLPFRAGRATLSPGIGAGVGSIHTHQDGTGQSAETGGPHADLHLSLSYPLWHRLALELAASIDVTQTTHVETSSAILLPDEPRLFARFGAGVRFGAL